MNGVLIDTSFLITFSDPTRPNHPIAVKYYREFIKHQVPMYLSTVCISEFEVKQSVNDLPLHSFITLPFNVDHAIKCGKFNASLTRDSGDNKAAVKDDVKLIAQCEINPISHIIHEDASTLHKYLSRLNATHGTIVKGILLKNGFDPTLFSNGQHALFDKSMQ